MLPARTAADELLPLVPSPSCPSTFSPQHCTVPFPRTAQVWENPPLTATAPAIPPARTALDEVVMVPSPRCPESPAPQHPTVPSPSSAHACSAPATTRVAVVRPLTATGTEELVKVPSPLPSCPNWFRPVHCAVPSERRTQLKNALADTAVGVRAAPLAVNCCV